MRLKLYYHTLRHLKPIQIWGRIWFKLKKIKPDLRPAPSMRKLINPWQFPILKSPNLIGPNQFFLLNETYQLTDASSWNNSSIKKLLLYNLHYFDDLNANSYQAKKHWHDELITRWISDNPPGLGNGWEPYTLSLRIVNWIKWALNNNSLPQHALNSLATQIRFLRSKLEFHLLGNHLLANAKALMFAGLFFSGIEAENWLRKGFKILSQQLPEQILNDGGHFELSPMYHSIILEDMLDIINILQTYNQIVPTNWLTTIRKMFQWLNVMCHPDGNIALFNDAALKIAPTIKELVSYATRLGINYSYHNVTNSTYLANSGYTHLTRANIHLIADVANIGPSYLPAHGHADTLTFELSYKTQRIIVNSGTSCYEDSAARQYERSTVAHNTIVIDQHNSSNIWSSFRVAERALPFDIKFNKQQEKTYLSASHTGYHRLPDKVTHQRTWCLTDHELIITDTLIGKNKHTIDVILHLHPDIQIAPINAHNFVLMCDDQKLAELTLDEVLNVIIADSTYHPEFGCTIRNKKLVGTINIDLPLQLTTVFKF